MLLGKHGYSKGNLPTGMIIGVCKHENCLKVNENNGMQAILQSLSGNDYFLGDNKLGGYAWEVKDMQLLDDFIPAKGKHGSWEPG
ncbi:hypothetical protein SC499_19365 [Peribacillus simplex]|uniref:hypothetical protein n=1 Tax=Peribacillus simplex TaxID=1478 RepID=UPI00298E2475|nr:hypothetical protein [Peribacillus simplex]MDW7616815.1 hypothetical protein [Peribacillus simplex]